MKRLLILLPPIMLTMLYCSTTPATAPQGSKVEAREILRQLEEGQHIHVEGKEIIGDLDFTVLKGAYPEGAGIWRTEVGSSVTFEKCTFLGKVSAFRKDGKKIHQTSFQRNLTFMDCTFDKVVDLNMMYVEGDSRWQNSIFKDTFYLTGAQFSRAANFQNTNFTGQAFAQDVVFYGKTNFLDAVFEATTTFQASQFHQDAQFGAVRFLGYVEFNQAWASKGFFFNYAQFFDRAYFRNARFDDRTEFLKADFKKEASFANSRFNGPSKYNEIVVGGSLSFENCQFQVKPGGWEELQGKPGGTIQFNNAVIKG